MGPFQPPAYCSHPGCAGYFQVGRRTGAIVEVIPEEPDGEISTRGLEALIARGRRPALVAITHVPTNCGWALMMFAGEGDDCRRDCPDTFDSAFS